MADILDLHLSLSKFSLDLLDYFFWKRTLGWFLNDNPAGLPQPSRNKNHQQNIHGRSNIMEFIEDHCHCYLSFNRYFAVNLNTFPVGHFDLPVGLKVDQSGGRLDSLPGPTAGRVREYA